jgi:hypothetical protein
MDSDLNNRSAETGNRRSQNHRYHEKYLIFWVFIYLFLSSQCVEKNNCTRRYHLQFQASITPSKDTITLSDTLWYEMRIGDDIFDNNSNSIIPTNGVEFPFYFAIAELDSTDFYSATQNFDYLEMNGSLVFQHFSGFTRIKIIMTYINNEYVIKFAFSPKKTGIFNVGLFTLTEEVEDLSVGDLGCISIINDISITMNELR